MHSAIKAYFYTPTNTTDVLFLILTYLSVSLSSNFDISSNNLSFPVTAN